MTDSLEGLSAELRKAAKTFFPDEGTIKICPDCKLEKCEVVNVEGLLWSCECGYEAFISESDLENKWLPAGLAAKEMERIKEKVIDLIHEEIRYNHSEKLAIEVCQKVEEEFG